MKEIKIILQPFMLDQVLDVLKDRDDLPGITVSEVLGWGKTRGEGAAKTERQGSHAFVKKTKIEIVVTDEKVDPIVDIVGRAARTGRPGDGKIFVIEVRDVLKIRTGERGEEAL